MTASSLRTKVVVQRSFSHDFSPELERFPASRNPRVIVRHDKYSSVAKSCEAHESTETLRSFRRAATRNEMSRTLGACRMTHNQSRRNESQAMTSSHDDKPANSRSRQRGDSRARQGERDSFNGHCRMAKPTSHRTMLEPKVQRGKRVATKAQAPSMNNQTAAVVAEAPTRRRSTHRPGRPKAVKFNERVRIVHYARDR